MVIDRSKLPANVQFTDDPVNSLRHFLDKNNYSRTVVLVDENTKKFCYEQIKDALPPHELITVPAGEEHKTLSTCETIWQAMTDIHVDRHALMIVLGGGVIGDMGGFCAATYKRGIDFILVPTTLLAQVDASIGGKLGIDFNHFKNHIGVFQLPVLTLLYSGFLDTLPKNELRSGFAEVIKHILTADHAMWDVISRRTLEQQDWNVLIPHSVSFKAQVVKEDPKEKGKRKILNAGHTIGHALETYFISQGQGQRILHGEAVAAGLVAECHIACKRNMLTETDLLSIKKYILQIYDCITLSDDDIYGIAQLTQQDKKNKGDKVLCVLQRGIGNAEWDQEITLTEVKEALSYYCSQT